MYSPVSGLFLYWVAKTFTLAKTERLKSRKSIEKLFSAGRHFFIYPFKVYFTFSSSVEEPPVLKAGVAVSARNFKKAVDRNRVKRLTREAYRLQKEELQQKLAARQKSLELFFVYVGKEIPVFAQLHEKLRLILERLIQKADEDNT